MCVSIYLSIYLSICLSIHMGRFGFRGSFGISLIRQTFTYGVLRLSVWGPGFLLGLGSGVPCGLRALGAPKMLGV